MNLLSLMPVCRTYVVSHASNCSVIPAWLGPRKGSGHVMRCGLFPFSASLSQKSRQENIDTPFSTRDCLYISPSRANIARCLSLHRAWSCPTLKHLTPALTWLPPPIVGSPGAQLGSPSYSTKTPISPRLAWGAVARESV